jgi:hypothetical protein
MLILIKIYSLSHELINVKINENQFFQATQKVMEPMEQHLCDFYIHFIVEKLICYRK